jgi:tetratricopeptide (TPR) repeat protein
MKSLLTVLLVLSLSVILPAQQGGDDTTKAERLEKRLRLADELESQGDDDGALQILSELADAAPANVELQERVVGMLMRNERFAEAIPRLRKLLELKEGNAAEYSAVGRMMIEVKEFESAVSFLDEASKRFPESPDFPFLATFPLGNLERWADAIAQFEKTINLAGKTDPEILDERFYFRYATARERNKNFAEAEKLFRKTLDLIKVNDPSGENSGFTATVLNYLAYMWLEQGNKLDEAGEMAAEAARLDPQSGAIADTVGWHHFLKGDYPRALVSLKKAESLIDEPDAVIYDHLGQTLAKLNEKDLAAEYFRKALELDPKNEDLKSRLGSVQ